MGCKAVIYVEYVPVDIKSAALAVSDTEREQMSERLVYLRGQYPDILFISFPGDEKSSGGCLAAGRGFFHINSSGGAEPCPFSPYSDANVKECGLRGAMHSRLFSALQNGEFLTGDHSGGCVLFDKRRQVEELLRLK
jgi:MoaA/NifB/PqqE/SkfB family radical SAM enzyme